MITTSTSANVLSTANKIAKSASQSRKTNTLRLSLRRFSHHGSTAGSKTTNKTEPGVSDTNTSTLDVEVYPWSRCQHAILRLAQGQRVDADERSRIAVSVRNLVFGSRNLASVLLSELFAATCLQSAFKQLAKSFFANGSTLDSIVQLWTQFYTSILPDLHSVLYSFEELSENDIRKMSLGAFRDSVVLDRDSCYEILNTSRSDINTSPIIRSMLLIIEQNTRDGATNYATLQTLCEKWIDDFSSCEISDSQSAPLMPSRLFFLEEEISLDRRPASPKSIQRLLRRAKGSFSALTTSDQANSMTSRPNYLEVKSAHENGRSRSPLARMKNALLSENGGGILRRHSYAPGT